MKYLIHLSLLFCLLISVHANAADGVLQTVNSITTVGALSGSNLPGNVLTNQNVNSWVLFTNNGVSLSYNSSGIFTLTNYAAANLGVTFSTNGTLMTGLGSASLPALQIGASNYGWYKTGNNIALSFNGSLGPYIDNTELHLSSLTKLSWNDTAIMTKLASGVISLNTNFISAGTASATNGANFGSTYQFTVDSSGNVIAPKITVTNLINAGVIALTESGSAFATDASLGSYFRGTLTGNDTLSNPSNPSDGQKVIWCLIQDGTGSRTITMGSKFGFGTDITGITLTTTANKRDFITAIYDLATDKWNVAGFSRGY